ncbi:MAG: 50S ribosomal protein L21 [Parcubacteria group bacterium]|nr:50S ribosomal protein L21 [Parcubacteria group bacterium]
MLAIIKTGGKQYKVKEKSLVRVEKLDGEKGITINFPEVLLISDDEGKEVKVGAPVVEGAKVVGVIRRQGKAKKIDVIKYKKDIRYKRKYGHRQPFTEVEITSIVNS